MKKFFCLMFLVLVATVAFSQGNPAQFRRDGNKTWFKDYKTYNGFGTSTPSYTWHFAGQVYSTSLVTPSATITALTATSATIGSVSIPAVTATSLSATTASVTTLNVGTLVSPSVTGPVAVTGALSSTSFLTGNTIIAGTLTATTNISAASFSISDNDGTIKVKSANGSWWAINVSDAGALTVTSTTAP